VQARGADLDPAVDTQAKAVVGHAFERFVDRHQLGGLALFQRNAQVALGIGLGPVVALLFMRLSRRFRAAHRAAALSAQLRHHIGAHLAQLLGEGV
jgi:hypothetical protein